MIEINIDCFCQELSLAASSSASSATANMQAKAMSSEPVRLPLIFTPADGEPVRIVPGDLVSFHAGLDSQWEVVKPLRKHYSYDYPDGV